MTIAQNSVLRAVATFDLEGISKAQNVYHLTHDSDGSADDVEMSEDVAEAIENAMDAFAANIVDGCSLDKVEVFERSGGEWQPVATVSSSWAGTNGGDRPPAGVALMVELYKARTGYADRKYIAGMADTTITGDTFGSGTLSNADNYVTAILASYLGANGNTVEFVHYNRVTEALKSYTGGAGVSTASYQRRRKPGVGLT